MFQKEAVKIFKQREEPYKLEILKEIKDEETVGLYFHEEYIDMCRGPHVNSMTHLKAFKLTHVAGAYWRGDSKIRCCKEFMERLGIAKRVKKILK